jgi:hypothetical protein
MKLDWSGLNLSRKLMRKKMVYSVIDARSNDAVRLLELTNIVDAVIDMNYVLYTTGHPCMRYLRGLTRLFLVDEVSKFGTSIFSNDSVLSKIISKFESIQNDESLFLYSDVIKKHIKNHKHLLSNSKAFVDKIEMSERFITINDVTGFTKGWRVYFNKYIFNELFFSNEQNMWIKLSFDEKQVNRVGYIRLMLNRSIKQTKKNKKDSVTEGTHVQVSAIKYVFEYIELVNRVEKDVLLTATKDLLALFNQLNGNTFIAIDNDICPGSGSYMLASKAYILRQPLNYVQDFVLSSEMSNSMSNSEVQTIRKEIIFEMYYSISEEYIDSYLVKTIFYIAQLFLVQSVYKNNEMEFMRNDFELLNKNSFLLSSKGSNSLRVDCKKKVIENIISSTLFSEETKRASRHFLKMYGRMIRFY